MANNVLTPYDEYPYRDLLKDLGDYYVLIGRLAWEKYMGRSSSRFWTWWVDTLPIGNFSHIAMWNENDMQTFKMVSLMTVDEANFKYDDTFEHYQQYRKRLEGDINISPMVYSRETFLWAVLTIHSRGFGFTKKMVHSMLGIDYTGDDANDNTIVLGPATDLANHHGHSYSQDKSRYESNSYSIYLLAGRDFTAGEEFTISYGPKDNFQLMKTYGFVMENNINEAFNMTHRDPDHCLGDLEPESGACTYVLRPNMICEELIQKYREFILQDVKQAHVDVEDYKKHFISLQKYSEKEESQKSFLLAFVYYRTSIKMVVDGAVPLRILSRDANLDSLTPIQRMI